jgi:hypothetical protein
VGRPAQEALDNEDVKKYKLEGRFTEYGYPGSWD